MSDTPTLKKLGKLTGLSDAQLMSVVQEIQANQQKLDACRGPHKFVRQDKGEAWSRQQSICSLCQGYVNSTAASWYEKGLAHATRH